MNKFIKDYIDRKEEIEKKRLAKEVHKIIQYLEIGDKVYDEQYKQLAMNSLKTMKKRNLHINMISEMLP